MNAESFVAISFLLLLFIRKCRAPSVAGQSATRTQTIFASTSLIALCIACFGWSLSTPFLFDDYGHVAFASTATFHGVVTSFFEPHSDIFFRPLGFLSYYLDFKWAHFDPFRWHCWNLAIHILNCLLLFVLARRLCFSALGSAFAGIVFAIHGSRAETVSWTDARFDLLATFFVLAALVSFKRYAKASKISWLGTGLVCGVLAFITKEASFCLPLLVITLIPLSERDERRKLWRATIFLSFLCVLAFVYRLWVIGGIGGYETGGHPNVLNLSVIRTLKALAWRMWAVLFFPINWVSGTGLWLTAGIVVFLVGLSLALTKSRAGLLRPLASSAFVIAAALPVQQLLLIGTGLGDARILYLPVIGLALFWAALLDSAHGKHLLQYSLITAVSLFNVTALEHNIHTWRQVAQESRAVCQSFGRQVSTINGPVLVSGVPDRRLGIYFLSNGFAECVQQNSGVPAIRILTAPAKAAHHFVWNSNTLGFDQIR